MARGNLRIFLGAAPGVGKTYSMLEEGHTLLAAGVDAVVGIAVDHGRPQIRALAAGLPTIRTVPRSRADAAAKVPGNSVTARSSTNAARSSPDGAAPTAALHQTGADGQELDVEAVLARHPAVVLVDELAHSNPPGSRHATRWEDVEELLDAGIDVISTVDVQHLVSLGDVVEAITGARQPETVPDDVVRTAEQIELVDITPELLRQRISEGRVYAPEQVDAALANYFRVGNLTALRELALLWLADRVEEGLAKYRAKHGIDTSWSTRERVVVGLTGGPEGEVLIRRAARILNRVSGGELLAVHVRRSDGVEGESPQDLEAQRQLTTDLGGTYHSVGGDDPAQALLDFARSVSATQIVVGTSRRRPLARFLAGSGVGAKVVRDSGDIDVHMVTHPLGGRGVPRPNRGDLGRTRVTAGFALAVVLPIAVQLLIGAMGSTNFALATLVQFTAAIAVALVGGLWPAVLAAIWGSLLLNYFSAPPVRTLAISDPQNLLTLVLFVAVSAAVAVAVDRSARRSKEAILAGAEAATLSELARGVLASEDTVQIFLEQVREHFQVASVALFRRGPRRDDDGGPAASSAQQVAGATNRKVPRGPGPDGAEQTQGQSGPQASRTGSGDGAPGGPQGSTGGRSDGTPGGPPGSAAGAAARDAWTLHASVGEPPPSSPADADNVEEISENLALALTGRTLPATDRRLLGAFGAHLMAMEQRDQLSLTRKANLRLAEGNKMRTAVLRAVSHDLRTPLAGIKLAVSSLRQDAVTFTPSEEAELLATIENYSDRLDVLVDNLLDMSRLSSDTVTPLLLPVGWLSVLPAALRGVPDGRVRLELPPNMPAVEADPGMLERVIANIVENAVKYAPESEILIVGTVGGSGSSTIEGQPASELRIIDRGRGVPAEDVVAMFRPFQRLDDISFRADGSTGVGLGLAVAKGFTEAMGGRLDAEKTPGGGLTMVIRLPISSGVARRREL